MHCGVFNVQDALDEISLSGFRDYLMTIQRLYPCALAAPCSVASRQNAEIRGSVLCNAPSERGRIVCSGNSESRHVEQGAGDRSLLLTGFTDSISESWGFGLGPLPG